MQPALHNGFPRHSPPARAAARTRPRWQPYNPNSQSASISPKPYLSTPPLSTCSSSSSSSSSTHATPNQPDQPMLSQPTLPRDSVPRDSAKNKYAVGLVGESIFSCAFGISNKKVLDMAVHALCDIWHPHYIPPAYRSASLSVAYATLVHQSTIKHIERIKADNLERISHLPSPITPSTCNRSPPIAFPEVSPGVEEDLKPLDPKAHASRLRGFVTEVLRRSKTSGYILQTALCYLEAIKGQIPELAKKEEEGRWDEPESQDRIIIAQQPETDDCASLMSIDEVAGSTDSDIATVRLNDCSDLPSGGLNFEPAAASSAPLQVHLPTALLCPRRTFLAALILASKFLQDKSYSNRAWAKLSGLPPREISRCERAMGAALDWRLWVGRGQPSPPPSAASSRQLSRSQSEASILTTPSARSPFMENAPAPTPSNVQRGPSRSLSRSATVPTSVFGQAKRSAHVSSPESALWVGINRSFEVDVLKAPDVYEKSDVDTMDTSIPPTPGLTYSPSSTESSSGDRTIQMTTFLDDPTPVSIGTIAVNTASDPWTWLDASDGSGIAPGKLSPFVQRSFAASDYLPKLAMGSHTEESCGAQQCVEVKGTSWSLFSYDTANPEPPPPMLIAPAIK